MPQLYCTLSLILTAYKNPFFVFFSFSLYVGFVPVSNLLDIYCSIWQGVFSSKFLFMTEARSVINFLWYCLRYYSIVPWIVPPIVPKPSQKTWFFVEVLAPSEVLFEVLFFPFVTKEHQHQRTPTPINPSININCSRSISPTPINYQNLPRRSCPLSLPSPPLPPLPRCPSRCGRRPYCRRGHCCPCCPHCSRRPSHPSRPRPSCCHPHHPFPRCPCYCPRPPPPPNYPCELWSHVTTPVMISTKNSTQADFFFLSQRPFWGTISAPARK
jgi:hypothetical protein